MTCVSVSKGSISHAEPVLEKRIPNSCHKSSRRLSYLWSDSVADPNDDWTQRPTPQGVVYSPWFPRVPGAEGPEMKDSGPIVPWFRDYLSRRFGLPPMAPPTSEERT